MCQRGLSRVNYFVRFGQVNCRLTDLVTLESSHMEGIEAAFAARCELCDQDTWALKAGTIAVADVSTAIDSVTGGVGKIGVTNKPKS